MRNVFAIVFASVLLVHCNEKADKSQTTLTQIEQEKELLAPTFRRPIDDDSGKVNTKRYRESNRKQISDGVWYTQEEMARYIDTIYPIIVDAQRAHIRKYLEAHPKFPLDTTLYEWKVAMYWMLNKDSNDRHPGPPPANPRKRVKVDFCVVPTLVRKSDSTVLDFFDRTNNPFYGHNLEIPLLKKFGILAGKGSAYNSGVMWP